jgi:hypothetical protein
MLRKIKQINLTLYFLKMKQHQKMIFLSKYGEKNIKVSLGSSVCRD